MVRFGKVLFGKEKFGSVKCVLVRFGKGFKFNIRDTIHKIKDIDSLFDKSSRDINNDGNGNINDTSKEINKKSDKKINKKKK